MSSRKMISFASLLLVVFSCKDSPTLLEQAEDAYNTQVAELCECSVQDGEFPDVATCKEEFGPLSEDTDPDCFNKVLTDPAYRSWIDCNLKVEQDLADCLKDEPCLPRFSCADGSMDVPGSYRCDGDNDCADGSDENDCDGVPPNCLEKYGQALLACGSAPDGYFDALDACRLTRMCSNGEEIPESWWCDGEADCEDGSDEASC